MHLKIWERLFGHYTSELKYMAEQAYMEQTMQITPIQIKLDFKGFSDSLSKYVLQVLEKLSVFDALENREMF